VDIIREGYDVIITHGNGPQVGDILLRNEMARDTLPPDAARHLRGREPGMIGYIAPAVAE